MLGLKDGGYYSLNDGGTRICDLVQEPKTAGDIGDAILEYGVEPGRCERDILAILADLEPQRLVEARHHNSGYLIRLGRTIHG